jgi:hypothetical protein
MSRVLTLVRSTRDDIEAMWLYALPSEAGVRGLLPSRPLCSDADRRSHPSTHT